MSLPRGTTVSSFYFYMGANMPLEFQGYSHHQADSSLACQSISSRGIEELLSSYPYILALISHSPLSSSSLFAQKRPSCPSSFYGGLVFIALPSDFSIICVLTRPFSCRTTTSLTFPTCQTPPYLAMPSSPKNAVIVLTRWF